MKTIQDTQHLLDTMPELDALNFDGLEPIMNLLVEGSLEKQPLRLLMEDLFTDTSNFQDTLMKMSSNVSAQLVDAFLGSSIEFDRVHI